MALAHSPRIVTDGLVLCLDAGNTKSYPGPLPVAGWYDLSGNGNNGTFTAAGAPTYDSANGGSLSFDGVNNYVTLGNNKLKYQDNFTLEAFCRFPNLPNNAAVCGARHPIVYNHDYGYNLLVGSNGKVYWNVYNTSSTNINISSINSVVGSNYFHVVAIKSGTTCSLYANGIFQSSANLTTNAVAYELDEPFVIGGFATCGGNRFYSTGNISILKAYNRALTATEIQQNFNALRGRYGI